MSVEFVQSNSKRGVCPFSFFVPTYTKKVIPGQSKKEGDLKIYMPTEYLIYLEGHDSSIRKFGRESQLRFILRYIVKYILINFDSGHFMVYVVKVYAFVFSVYDRWWMRLIKYKGIRSCFITQRNWGCPSLFPSVYLNKTNKVQWLRDCIRRSFYVRLHPLPIFVVGPLHSADHDNSRSSLYRVIGIRLLLDVLFYPRGRDTTCV